MNVKCFIYLINDFSMNGVHCRLFAMTNICVCVNVYRKEIIINLVQEFGTRNRFY